MRPCHCPEASIIVKQLDSIAEMVAVHLLESVGGEDCGLDVKRLRQSPLEKVVEKGLPVDAVLAALNTVLYDHLGFRGAGDSYYELGSSFIDLVRMKDHIKHPCSLILVPLYIVYRSWRGSREFQLHSVLCMKL